jgi:sec-independent protein translocase protein TatA
MGIESPVHLLFVAAIALIVLGPKKLPEVARALGRSMREFREAVSGGAAEGAGESEEPTAVVTHRWPSQEAPEWPSGETLEQPRVEAHEWPSSEARRQPPGQAQEPPAVEENIVH